MDVQRNYDIFDLTKFILSIFIVSIHSGIVSDIFIPIVRIAVPMFFIITSYLLFSKKISGIFYDGLGGGVYCIDLPAGI